MGAEKSNIRDALILLRNIVATPRAERWQNLGKELFLPGGRGLRQKDIDQTLDTLLEYSLNKNGDSIQHIITSRSKLSPNRKYKENELQRILNYLRQIRGSLIAIDFL